MRRRCPKCKRRYTKIRDKNVENFCPNCGYKETKWTLRKIKQLIWNV